MAGEDWERIRREIKGHVFVMKLALKEIQDFLEKKYPDEFFGEYKIDEEDEDDEEEEQ